MKEHFLELLEEIDRTGAECPGHTRAFMATMLLLLAPPDRYDTLRFLLEYADSPPAPKPRLQVIVGGLT